LVQRSLREQRQVGRERGRIDEQRLELERDHDQQRLELDQQPGLDPEHAEHSDHAEHPDAEHPDALGQDLIGQDLIGRMSATILDGKALANQLVGQLRERVGELQTKGVEPCLAVVLVGDDPASQVYVRGKEKRAAEAGIATRDHRLPAETSTRDLLELVDRLNRDPAVHGILVQLPLPAGIDEQRILQAVDPRKDVDGFHPDNLGLLMLGRPRFVACTPQGCMRLIAAAGVDLTGKDALIVGRSNIVGKPMGQLLLQANATVTTAHSKTRDLEALVRRAEVVIAAIGRPEFIRGEWIRAGACVIDVGINRLASGKLVGDVEFEPAKARAGSITPVPGGVGPMTIACLLANVVDAASR